MEQTEKNKIIVDLNENIKTLKETIKQQEKLLVQLLTELDKTNGIEYDFDEDILDNEENDY